MQLSNDEEEDDEYEDIEAIEVETFFQGIYDIVNIELTDEQVSSIIRVAARHIQTMEGSASTSVVFIYKDIEIILGAYGFMDEVRRPESSENMQYHLLDLKSIRIMNRLASYMA